ncbi:MAG: hypothetical protein ABSE66_09805 [Thermoplasmata archaeon]|jgi:hypothetical protein
MRLLRRAGFDHAYSFEEYRDVPCYECGHEGMEHEEDEQGNLGTCSAGTDATGRTGPCDCGGYQPDESMGEPVICPRCHQPVHKDEGCGCRWTQR